MKLINKYRNGQLSKNWWRHEIACKGGNACCGGVAVAHPLMIQLAQALRDRLGVPVFCCHPDYPTAGSGFRCIKHNEEVHGVPGSYHTLGCAWDLWSLERSARQIYDAALVVITELGYGHAILYEARGFVHLDIYTRY